MSKSSNKVGIVIVTFNAAEAARVTLASLRRARTDVAFEVILVDNASDEAERAMIRAAMATHIAANPSWRYIEQESNLGFSGGNNVGISAFLADDTITHICLLNSDVIVTDNWLDRLVAAERAIVSSVTNRADSEQWIPVDYELQLDECLDSQAEALNEHAYRRVNDFAGRWHAAWRGNLAPCDVTFFCVLLQVPACRVIGLLDETFFPGGFEDDDYCLRARAAGYEIHLLRDTYLHHWGSASFGKLQYEYFSERARRNRQYLEDKHGIVWARRPEKPLVSFAMDAHFALGRPTAAASPQAPFLRLHVEQVSKQVDYFESEYSALRSALLASGEEMPAGLRQQVDQADAFGDLRQAWDAAAQRMANALGRGAADEAERAALMSVLERIAAGIHDRVECNFAIHGFLTERSRNGAAAGVPVPSTAAAAAPRRPTSLPGKLLWYARRALSFGLRFDGIVFFGGYFYPERQSDGYFQRIQMIDRMFTDRWRVYVESDELPGRGGWLDRPEPKVLVLRILGSSKRRMLVRALALLAVLRCRKVYFHSVLRMHDNRFGKLLHLPFLRKAVDIHGVVPEEFRMHNDFFSAVLYEREEGLAVEKAGMVVVVTNAMGEYLQQKFRDRLKAHRVCLPMFPSFAPVLQERPLQDGKPVVVYAGGLHKWQQVPKMVDAIVRTAERCHHRFYCPQPDVVKAMLPPAAAALVTVEAKTHAELMKLYPQCHYGFILREDNVVNRVACPTKLVEYIAMGIIPIMDGEDVGDFRAMGLRFVTLPDFLAGRLPSEAQLMQMARENLHIYEELKRVRQAGAEGIYDFFTKPRGAPRDWSVLGWARRMLPAHSLPGRAARRVWRAIAPAAGPAAAASAAQAPLVDGASLDPQEEPGPCDILVQVDNFEAGGLENVVLDLNAVLSRAGYRVVLLVLGNRGLAVQRAVELGQTVICRTYAEQGYTSLLKRLRPKLVLAHYSHRGVELCHREAIPFVQVIHNIYMWFSEQQRWEFAATAPMTSAFVAVSDVVRRYSISRLGLPAAKCVVIPNGIDVQSFRTGEDRLARRQLRARHGIAEDEFVFLDVGSINHQKNHLGMIRAFEIFSRSVPKARLVVLGPCYETELLREMLSYIEQHGLSGKVLYCGAAPEVHGFMSMADAFASATFFEAGPLTLLEAIAANLPVAMPAVGLAERYRECAGIELVDPAYDMMEYTGSIAELRTHPAFEERLAAALMRVWAERRRPDFSEQELADLDKDRCYQGYVRLVSELLGTQAAVGDAPRTLEPA